ncbi:hypothetical protein UP06_14860 [Bradyrhizobium sp. LTSP857]|nr:hypothetical protein UP06_14860 [Bradyrhizobium sp. LTSP857]
MSRAHPDSNLRAGTDTRILLHECSAAYIEFRAHEIGAKIGPTGNYRFQIFAFGAAHLQGRTPYRSIGQRTNDAKSAIAPLRRIFESLDTIAPMRERKQFADVFSKEMNALTVTIIGLESLSVEVAIV